MRAFARARASRGIRAGSGNRSSMYSRMIVESKIAKSPSIRAGTSARGLALMKSSSAWPEPIAVGIFTSNGTPFS
jgi:hypothetical protein